MPASPKAPGTRSRKGQIYVTMDQPTIDRLEREVKLGFTEKADDTHTVMRICTSWATTHEEVDQLIELL